MESQIFRNLSGRANVIWLGEILEIPPSKNVGIDLIDDEFGIEIKSRLKTYPPNFAVHSYQILLMLSLVLTIVTLILYNKWNG